MVKYPPHLTSSMVKLSKLGTFYGIGMYFLLDYSSISEFSEVKGYPNCPLFPAPHVNSYPLVSIAAQCQAPQLIFVMYFKLGITFKGDL